MNAILGSRLRPGAWSHWPYLRMAAVLFVSPGWQVQASALPLDASWTFSRAERSCVLEQRTPAGSARFSGEPGLPLRFEYMSGMDPFGQGAVGVSADAPEWHPAWPDSRDRGALAHVREGAITAREPVATLLLADLGQGRLIRLLGRGASGEDDDVHAVAIMPIRLRDSYRAFVACRQWEKPADFADMELSRIGFDSGEASLSATGRARLARLAHYIRSDRMLSAVLIDGHADPQVEQRTHLALSQRRAAAVADDLVRRGVPRGLLVVNFHGSAYPLDARPGAFPAPQNRRVTVKLRRVEADATGTAASALAIR